MCVWCRVISGSSLEVMTGETRVVKVSMQNILEAEVRLHQISQGGVLPYIFFFNDDLLNRFCSRSYGHSFVLALIYILIKFSQLGLASYKTL
jgi:hypothetical protein